ncbi:MAG: YceI family protein, partial [Chloroflexota bacterium]
TTPATSPVASAVAGDTIHYGVVADGTRAQFKVREQLANRSFPSDAIGTTQAVTGGITIGADGKIVSDQSKFVAELRTLKSDSAKRDGYIQRSTLNTEEYPTAVFVPTAATGLTSPLPTSGKVAFQLLGNLTVHGVTHPVTWNVTGQVDGNQVAGQATTSFKFEDFGMSPPHVFVVLSVQDNINLQMDFLLARGA